MLQHVPRKTAVKICVTSGTFHPDVGGPPTYLHALCPDLLGRGHQLKVVTYGRSKEAYPYPIRRIPREFPAPVRLAQFGLAILDEARTADLLFVNDYGLPPTAANLLLRKPLVMKIVGDFAWEYATRHGLVPSGLSIDEFQRRPFGPAVERVRVVQTWYARRAELVITPSNYLAEMIAGWGVSRERVRVIYNAPPPIEGSVTASEPRDFLEISEPDILVATVGRLAPWKGVDVLILALEKARREAPDLKLVVIGDGDERSRLERLAEPLDGAVHFVGQVERPRALALMRRADVLALSSAYEGLSHVLLEAMEAGTPIIASAVGGNLELIRDGENGLLVPSGDVTALAESLVRLAHDRGLAARLGEQARRDAQARSWPCLIDATLAVFEEAIELHRVARR